MNATKTKVALITPPVLEKVAHHPLFPPLGLAYMAAVLEQNGVEVKIIDSPVLDFDHQKIKAELESYQPTIVGVGSMTPTIESALKCAQIAKEAAPNAQVLMGGPHATFADTEILTSEKAVDVIVRGEGEETIVELAKQAPLSDVKGVTFRKDNQIIKTAARLFIHNRTQLTSNNK